MIAEDKPSPDTADPRLPVRDESADQRLDRNMNELLQELRVAQTGVQFLFAFLLALVFQQRFTTLDGFGRATYLCALGCALLSAGFLIAPVGYHRLVFRRQMKAVLVSVANRMALAGLAFLALAFGASVMLILDVIYGRVAAVVAGVLAAGWLATLWFAFPWEQVRKLRRTDPR